MNKFVFSLLIAVLLASGCTSKTPIIAPASTTATTITFTVPEELPPATVGVPYSFSFATAMNPTGGHPPYSFLLGSGVGFPPFGLVLDLNGLLHGTPSAAGTRTFEVCVKDLSGNQACGKTSLTVKAPEVWKGTFEIIGKEDQRVIGVDIVQEYQASGKFSFRILSDDTIEGSGTAQGEFTSLEISGDGSRFEGKASFTTNFSVKGYYYQGVESVIQFRDLSPSEFTITITAHWKRGETTSATLKRPVFYNFTFEDIGINIADGATAEGTSSWGGTGKIRRTVTLGRED